MHILVTHICRHGDRSEYFGECNFVLAPAATCNTPIDDRETDRIQSFASNFNATRRLTVEPTHERRGLVAREIAQKQNSQKRDKRHS